MKVCLLNDSFPPLVDGVAITVKNYAEIIHKKYGDSMVVVPYYPVTNDNQYKFPIIRYGSLKESRLTAGYRLGNLFSHYAKKRILDFKPDILHCHTPMTSLLLSVGVRKYLNVPLVLTYHTRIEVEVERIYKFKPIKKLIYKIVTHALSNCDEIWTVSKGAIQSLRNIGYNGDVIIMPNGVDMPKGKASQSDMEKLKRELGIPEGVLVYLFVGRMFWYKGIKLIIDALAKLKEAGKDYRMIFVGDGPEKNEMQQYARKMSISEKCIFTGAVPDRERLRIFYSIANLHIFPSTYDTFSLTVREALASQCPSLLIKGSSSAEGFTDATALLTDENVDSIYEKLSEYNGHDDDAKKLSIIGEKALNTLYVSWEDVIEKAVERYKLLINKYRG